MTENYRHCDTEHLRDYPGCFEECGHDVCTGGTLVAEAKSISLQKQILETQIKEVARAREEAQRLADEKAAKFKAWEEENLLFLEAVKFASEYRNEQENRLREMTLQVYAETGNKKPAEGVGIRINTELKYDPEQAFTYAKEHGVALKLDVSSFEKMSKIPELRPAFVEVIEKPIATIAQDLTF